MSKNDVDENVLEDKDVIIEFEAIRKSGLANMFDVKTVEQYTELAGFKRLLNVISLGLYSKLLQNYSRLMDKHEIER